MSGHSETVAMFEQLDDDVAAAAALYLDVAGPAPLSELVRNLSLHLEANRDLVTTALTALVAAGALSFSSRTQLVALPAGDATRDTEETR